MSNPIARLFLLATVATAVSAVVLGAEPEPPAPPPPEAPVAQPGAPPLELEKPRASANSTDGHGNFGDVIVHFGHDSHLDAGKRAEAVVAIGGSASSDGDVSDGVVSIMGNTRVNGSAEAAVAVFGNTYVNGEIQESAVAVFGDVELGPNAIVHDEVVAVGGVVKRDPAAIVRGGTREVSLPFKVGHLEWLHPWFKHCLLLGRPLALVPGIGWAWTLAFGFLALYVVIAMLFSSSVEKCVATLETRPGHSMLAALLSIFLSPLLTTILALTVVGAVLIPFAWVALFCAGIFGKVVILAALGRRLTRFIAAGPMSHIAFPVLLGGLILIGFYLVPFFGFILYKVTGVIGLGVVMYTLILALKAYREQNLPPAMAATAGGPGPMPVPMLATSGESFSDSASSSSTASGGSHETPYSGAYTGEAATATPPISSSLPRAGFWIRMAALFVDMLLVAIALATLDGSHVLLIAMAAYGAVMWKLKGTTIGGILCNLQVVRADDRELDWPTTSVRALSCFLSLTCLGLGFLWIAFDDNKQAWHDKIAGTVVVRVPKGVSLV
jgi:uncharacterized RDD family membrane protein YckC